MSSRPPESPSDRIRPLRWGFVGTGHIARRMASVVRDKPAATLSAVASRQMDSARSFATRHAADRAFDSWQEMLTWDGIDAVYIATPTSLRETIAIAAASAGKHVLGEKPFTSSASTRRITDACRARDVCFMDATHFVHHPRLAAIRDAMAETIGSPRSLDSRFLIGLNDRDNIRYDPALEPLGALGDLGWYNMRAAVEYLSTDGRPGAIRASVERDEAAGVVIGGEGTLEFGDGSVSRWRCSFTAGSIDRGLKLSGPLGTLCMDNFVGDDADGSASFTYEKTGVADPVQRVVRIDSHRSGPALMFEDFAAAVADRSRREPWMQASERTQALLDAILNAV